MRRIEEGDTIRWQPPQLPCKPLSAFDPNDWEAAARTFAQAASCTLGQGWLETPHPHLRPAIVRAGWLPHALWVYAELSDRDIYNAATRPNQDTWNLGDVLELFLRPLPQETWFEFHVTPENQTLQLRWPGPESTWLALYREQGMNPFYLSDPVFTSRTRIEPESQRWRVLAEIPARHVAATEEIQPGNTWLFSFSRYDYTRGEAEPALSSSSPHEVCQFDRQQEWGRLLFEG